MIHVDKIWPRMITCSFLQQNQAGTKYHSLRPPIKEQNFLIYISWMKKIFPESELGYVINDISLNHIKSGTILSILINCYSLWKMTPEILTLHDLHFVNSPQLFTKFQWCTTNIETHTSFLFFIHFFIFRLRLG